MNERATIEYEGGPRGLHVLVQRLRDAGLTVEYVPPREERGVGNVEVIVVLNVSGNLATMAFVATVKKALQAFREREPHPSQARNAHRAAEVRIRGNQATWGSE